MNFLPSALILNNSSDHIIQKMVKSTAEACRLYGLKRELIHRNIDSTSQRGMNKNEPRSVIKVGRTRAIFFAFDAFKSG